MGQKREGFDAAEHSDEVRRTSAGDCGLAEGFYLGRVRAGAYRGEGEHAGGLGAENRPLTWPAASGGASAGNGTATLATAGAALASVDGGYTIEIHIQNTVNMPRLQGETT